MSISSLDKLAMLLFDIRDRDTPSIFLVTNIISLISPRRSCYEQLGSIGSRRENLISCTHFPCWPRRSDHFAHQPRVCYHYSLSILLGQDGGSWWRRIRTHCEALSLIPLAHPITLTTFPKKKVNSHYEKLGGWRTSSRFAFRVY